MKPRDLHSHHCFAALLIVETDPIVPFAGEIVTAISTNEALSVQIAAHKMSKRLLAQFWKVKFKDSHFRLVSRGLLPGEYRDTVHLEMIYAPALEQKDDDHLTHTIRLYLHDTDCLTKSMIGEAERLHSDLHDNNKLVRLLKHENQKWAEYLERTIFEHYHSSSDQRIKLQKTEEELAKLRAESAE